MYKNIKGDRDTGKSAQEDAVDLSPAELPESDGCPTRRCGAIRLRLARRFASRVGSQGGLGENLAEDQIQRDSDGPRHGTAEEIALGRRNFIEVFFVFLGRTFRQMKFQLIGVLERFVDN